jgi:hypothetical protein
MSGVFHQMGTSSKMSWETYMFDILRQSYELSTKGIAWNFLSQKAEYETKGNYYASVSNMINFVSNNLSRFFVIQHNYPLFEATMFAYHPKYIAEKYPQRQFNKYL